MFLKVISSHNSEPLYLIFMFIVFIFSVGTVFLLALILQTLLPAYMKFSFVLLNEQICFGTLYHLSVTDAEFCMDHLLYLFEYPSLCDFSFILSSYTLFEISYSIFFQIRM